MVKEIKTFKGFLRFYERVVSERKKKAFLIGKTPKLPESYKIIAKGIIGSPQARKLFLKYNKSNESFLYSLIREYLTRR